MSEEAVPEKVDPPAPMSKRDFFLYGIKNNFYLYKQWVIECFSIARSDSGNYGPFVNYLPKEKPHGWTADKQIIQITDSVIGQPLLNAQDPITLLPGDLPNVTEKVETIYGVALLNAIVLCYPFGNKIPFVDKDPITGGYLDSLVVAKLTDYPPAGQEKDPTKIYVDEHLKYQEACAAMGGFGMLFSPTASPATLVIPIEVLKRRNELFAQHKDSLKDPVVLAAIDKELTGMVRAHLKKDSSAAFFISNKAIDVAIKKSMISYGMELGFNPDDPTVILPSLQEGLDFNNMAAIADSARSGSHARGAMTALAGQSVKELYRVFQNTKVHEEDCGSVLGLELLVTEDNHGEFVGRYMLVGGKPVRLDAAIIKPLIGKRITVRSPLRCNTVKPYHCARCVGDRSAMNPTGLHVEISDIGSVFMNVEMKAMHGKSLATTKINLAAAMTI